MSIPRIPGYIDQPDPNNLADLWSKPGASFPDELWPVAALTQIVRDPVTWLTVDEHFHVDETHGGRGCVVVPTDAAGAALKSTGWIGRDLGNVGIWGDGTFEDGLSQANDEFFVQARQPSGVVLPVIDVTLPFLWYWDAFPVSDGWHYLNHAGREQELIRWDVAPEKWKVEVRALELRQYLSARAQDAIVQVDIVTKRDGPKFDRVDDEFANQWAHFDLHILHNASMPKRKAFSRLLGQYIVSGLANSRVPRWQERREDRVYPEFIYSIDAETGQPLKHHSDHDQLGTYFDEDDSRLHYLTPIYFKREVLQPYAAQPSRYRLSVTRLECLDLWGMDISINSVGLVEAYLGDLGRDLPSDEWSHWVAYNVIPEGKTEEGRFRRDFLGQWANSKDPAGDLRRARARAAASSQAVLGAPIWKALDWDVTAEFESIMGPLTDEPSALGPHLLLLTKALVDAIDPVPLKTYLSTHEKGEQSLQLLRRLVTELGDDGDATKILRALQGFRSAGGVAHLAGSRRPVVAAALGISDMKNIEAFEYVASQLTDCLTKVADLFDTVGGAYADAEE
jgi:hypothetical protein